MKTDKLLIYAIAYELGIFVKDITSIQIVIEKDFIIVHYFARRYNTPINTRKVLSYSDICDIVANRSIITTAQCN